MRTALVTGANRGIGFAIACGLAAGGGIRVLAAARDGGVARDAAERIGSGAIGVELRLDHPAEAAARAAAIEAEHGPVDVLVNNAAVMDERDLAALDASGLGASVAVNALSPYALLHTLGPGMRERGYGRIVNVSSGWGSFAEGLTGPVAYSVSKATLNAITLTTARLLGERVKVNALCPGWVRTRMGGDAAPRTPLEGADTAIWLATLPDDGPTGGFFRDRTPIEW